MNTCIYCGVGNGLHASFCNRPPGYGLGASLMPPLNVCYFCNIGSGLHHVDCPNNVKTLKQPQNVQKIENPFGEDECILPAEFAKTLIEKGPLADWFKDQWAKPLCGVFPFVLPKGFPLTHCCSEHDSNYIRTRGEFLEDYIKDHTELKRINRYKPTIEAHNQAFYTCTLTYLNAQPWLVRTALEPFVYSFNRLVRDCGWTIWVGGTLLAVKDIKGIGNLGEEECEESQR